MNRKHQVPAMEQYLEFQNELSYLLVSDKSILKKIHFEESTSSDSEPDGRHLDEDYIRNQPPPCDYNIIRDSVIKIGVESTKGTKKKRKKKKTKTDVQLFSDSKPAAACTGSGNVVKELSEDKSYDQNTSNKADDLVKTNLSEYAGINPQTTFKCFQDEFPQLKGARHTKSNFFGEQNTDTHLYCPASEKHETSSQRYDEFGKHCLSALLKQNKLLFCFDSECSNATISNDIATFLAVNHIDEHQPEKTTRKKLEIGLSVHETDIQNNPILEVLSKKQPTAASASVRNNGTYNEEILMGVKNITKPFIVDTKNAENKIQKGEPRETNSRDTVFKYFDKEFPLLGDTSRTKCNLAIGSAEKNETLSRNNDESAKVKSLYTKSNSFEIDFPPLKGSRHAKNEQEVMRHDISYAHVSINETNMKLSQNIDEIGEGCSSKFSKENCRRKLNGDVSDPKCITIHERGEPLLLMKHVDENDPSSENLEQITITGAKNRKRQKRLKRKSQLELPLNSYVQDNFMSEVTSQKESVTVSETATCELHDGKIILQGRSSEVVDLIENCHSTNSSTFSSTANINIPFNETITDTGKNDCTESSNQALGMLKNSEYLPFPKVGAILSDEKSFQFHEKCCETVYERTFAGDTDTCLLGMGSDKVSQVKQHETQAIIKNSQKNKKMFQNELQPIRDCDIHEISIFEESDFPPLGQANMFSKNNFTGVNTSNCIVKNGKRATRNVDYVHGSVQYEVTSDNFKPLVDSELITIYEKEDASLSMEHIDHNGSSAENQEQITMTDTKKKKRQRTRKRKSHVELPVSTLHDTFVCEVTSQKENMAVPGTVTCELHNVGKIIHHGRSNEAVETDKNDAGINTSSCIVKKDKRSTQNVDYFHGSAKCQKTSDTSKPLVGSEFITIYDKEDASLLMKHIVGNGSSAENQEQITMTDTKKKKRRKMRKRKSEVELPVSTVQDTFMCEVTSQKGNKIVPETITCELHNVGKIIHHGRSNEAVDFIENCPNINPPLIESVTETDRNGAGVNTSIVTKGHGSTQNVDYFHGSAKCQKTSDTIKPLVSSKSTKMHEFMSYENVIMTLTQKEVQELKDSITRFYQSSIPYEFADMIITQSRALFGEEHAERLTKFVNSEEFRILRDQAQKNFSAASFDGKNDTLLDCSLEDAASKIFDSPSKTEDKAARKSNKKISSMRNTVSKKAKPDRYTSNKKINDSSQQATQSDCAQGILDSAISSPFCDVVDTQIDYNHIFPTLQDQNIARQLETITNILTSHTEMIKFQRNLSHMNIMIPKNIFQYIKNDEMYHNLMKDFLAAGTATQQQTNIFFYKENYKEGATCKNILTETLHLSQTLQKIKNWEEAEAVPRETSLKSLTDAHGNVIVKAHTEVLPRFFHCVEVTASYLEGKMQQYQNDNKKEPTAKDSIDIIDPKESFSTEIPVNEVSELCHLAVARFCCERNRYLSSSCWYYQFKDYKFADFSEFRELYLNTNMIHVIEKFNKTEPTAKDSIDAMDPKESFSIELPVNEVTKLCHLAVAKVCCKRNLYLSSSCWYYQFKDNKFADFSEFRELYLNTNMINLIEKCNKIEKAMHENSKQEDTSLGKKKCRHLKNSEKNRDHMSNSYVSSVCWYFQYSGGAFAEFSEFRERYLNRSMDHVSQKNSQFRRFTNTKFNSGLQNHQESELEGVILLAKDRPPTYNSYNIQNLNVCNTKVNCEQTVSCDSNVGVVNNGITDTNTRLIVMPNNGQHFVNSFRACSLENCDNGKSYTSTLECDNIQNSSYPSIVRKDLNSSVVKLRLSLYCLLLVISIRLLIHLYAFCIENIVVIFIVMLLYVWIRLEDR